MSHGVVVVASRPGVRGVLRVSLTLAAHHFRRRYPCSPNPGLVLRSSAPIWARKPLFTCPTTDRAQSQPGRGMGTSSLVIVRGLHLPLREIDDLLPS